jgi:AcrR family transcriptional regulator
MSKTESVTEREFKLQAIIEAAQNRFGIYGLEKTSMREIADDLGISKASLYYYFPDKESLYKSVLEKEQSEFIERIKSSLETIYDPEQLLSEYVVNRLSYFRHLLNLSRMRLEAYSDLKPLLRDTIQNFREKEKEIILKIFEDGIHLGIFEINNMEETASLFLDLLKGLRVDVINKKKTIGISDAEFDILLTKTVMFASIFIKGLKAKPSGNMTIN